MKEFEAVIGYESVKAELKQICDVLKNPEKYSRLGVKVPSGLLLHGNPGVGKTTMAKCLIKASGLNTFTCCLTKSNEEILSCITHTFEEAKKAIPSIVFLDDLDKFEKAGDYHSKAYVTVQSCIDNVKDLGVFVLATANDIESLPFSLVRSGRFDKIIQINTPRLKDGEKIIEYYLSKKSFVSNVDVGEIAKLLNGKSCADLENVLNEAGIYAGFQGKEKIDMDDIVRASLRILFNAPARLDYLSSEVIKKIAYHEAGHAVISEVLNPESVTLISICSYESKREGITLKYRPYESRFSPEYGENEVRCLLGGKASTELTFGGVDIGSDHDIDVALKTIELFIGRWASHGFDCVPLESKRSEAVKERREMHIYSEIERYYAETKRILIRNRDFLDKLATAIIEKKTITSKDIRAIKATCNISA